jgi:ubiquinone biosynthesis monooxygenase Coq6
MHSQLGLLCKTRSQIAYSFLAAARRYSTAATGAEHVDIAIVGGGPAGLALACALGSSHYILYEDFSLIFIRIASSEAVKRTGKIALIEGGDLSRVRSWSAGHDQFSNRVVSITNASRHFLLGTSSLEPT